MYVMSDAESTGSRGDTAMPRARHRRGRFLLGAGLAVLTCGLVPFSGAQAAGSNDTVVVASESGGDSFIPPAIWTPPVPTIVGDPVEGGVLSAQTTDWGDAVIVAYQWLVDGGPIAGATSATYTPTSADVTRSISVSVTGRRGTEEATSTSESFGPVEADTHLGVVVSQPVTITGRVAVGQTISADTEAWSPDGVELSYQWYIGYYFRPVAIEGATSRTYTITPEDLGTILSVEVTGYKRGYGFGGNAEATDYVVEGEMTAPTPTIGGNPEVGGTLSVDPGHWKPSDVELAYQWLANGQPIDGATSDHLTVDEALDGVAISVRVTGTHEGYVSTSVTSKTVSGGSELPSPSPSASASGAGAGATGSPSTTATVTKSTEPPTSAAHHVALARTGAHTGGVLAGSMLSLLSASIVLGLRRARLQ